MALTRRDTLKLSAVTVAGLTLPTACGTPKTVAESPAARGWAYQSPAGSQKYTEAQAVEHAQRFDLIVPNKNIYAGKVPAMKAANPDLQIIGYTNGAYAQKAEGTKYPDSWYLRDKTGAKIRSKGYGNYLMDVTNAGWIDDVTARCRYMIDVSKYDGALLDMMGPASVTPGYGTGLPVNPATGAVYTKSEWLAATTALAARVREQLAGPPLYTNGIGAGPAYFNKAAPTSQLFNGCDASLAEYWLRGAKESITRFPSESVWKLNLDMLTDASAKGKRVLITVKTWVSATVAQKEAWHRYSLATFLLGTDGSHSYQFIPSPLAADFVATDPVLAGLTIGTPTASYVREASGVYSRAFTNGRVVVNPVTHQAVIETTSR